MTLTCAILTAAGSGTRLGSTLPKAFVPLDGVPLVVHAARRLAASGVVDHIVVTAPASHLAPMRDLLAQWSVAADVVAGGGSRQASVACGIEAAPPEASVILVHDAARALAPAELIERIVAAVRAGRDGVIPTLAVTDTIKVVGQIDASGTARVEATPQRSHLRIVQTPQGFSARVLREVHAGAAERGADEATAATDDAALLEAAGHEVWTVPGDEQALKITTPNDLVTAHHLLASSGSGSGSGSGSASASAAAPAFAAAPAPAPASAPAPAPRIEAQHSPSQPSEPVMTEPTAAATPAEAAPAGAARLPRTGVGVDVHAFAPADTPREMWLGGLFWPGEQGLAGHSDADAAAHAAVDAILSAAGLGDLGSNFGTAEPEWAGASGVTLLAEAAKRVRAAGFEIGNIAVQVIGNRPRLGTRRAEAQAALSAAAGAPVTLAGTTSDHLGFTGRDEGVAAMATALIIPT